MIVLALLSVSLRATPAMQFWQYKPALVSVTFVMREPGEMYCCPFVVVWGDGTKSVRASTCTRPPEVWSETLTHHFRAPGEYTIVLFFVEGKRVKLTREVRVRIIH